MGTDPCPTLDESRLVGAEELTTTFTTVPIWNSDESLEVEHRRLGPIARSYAFLS